MRVTAALGRARLTIAVVSLAAATLLAADGGAWWAHRGFGHPGSEHLGAARPGDAAGAAAGAGPGRSPGGPAAAFPDPAASLGRPACPPGRASMARRRLDARLAAALAPVLRRHQGSIAAGVADPADGVTAVYHAGRAFDTASIVKADILAVLLLRLMRDVEPGQAWGVSAAAARGTRPAVKNGWLPLPPDGYWVINSIGVDRHDGRRLLIAVLSDGQPSEAAGIVQVEAAARAAATLITAAESGCHGSRVSPG